MLFFATLVLSCKPVAPQNALPPAALGAPVLDRVVKSCGVTVFQESPGQEIKVIGNDDRDSIVTIQSDGYATVMYLQLRSKNAVNAHLVRGKQVTIKVELVEIDGSHDGMEKCKPTTVTVK